MTKRFSFLLALLLALTLTLPALADTAFVDGLDADRVHLRESPQTTAKSLGLFFTGTPVSIEGAHGDFTKVVIGAQTGWIMTQYLTDVQPLYAGPAGMPLAGSAWVNLRMKPSLRDRVVGMLYPDSPFTVLGETSTGWYYARAGSTQGYLSPDVVFVSKPNMDWSLHHYAPTDRIDVAYPQFDHMPNQLNGLIEAKAVSLAENSGHALNELSLLLNADVMVCDRGLISIVFFGTGYVDGGAYPTTLLYTMNLDLHTLSDVPADRLLDLSDNLTDRFFAAARRPAVTHDDLDPAWFDERLAQQKQTTEQFGSPFLGCSCYLTPEGPVLVLPAIHASGSDYFEALVPWDEIADRWLLPTAMPR